jgi:hypothetical protein
MKKSFFITMLMGFILIALFPVPIQAQPEYIMNFGTVANSTAETGYFHFKEFAKLHGIKEVDSVHAAIYAEGEADIDDLDLYPGFHGSHQLVEGEAYTSGALNYTVTTNLDSAAVGIVRLLEAGATVLTKVALRGYNSVKAIITPAASGNDATDPNKCWVVFTVYGKYAP